MARRKGRDDLTPIGELLPGLVPIKKGRLTPKPPTPQGEHHFTRIRQIDALASLPEDGSPELGFMARLLTLWGGTSRKGNLCTLRIIGSARTLERS